ncbi:MAG: hypothetical protein ACYCW6_29310 [Candidatus Xenobia bacterium]
MRIFSRPDHDSNPTCEAARQLANGLRKADSNYAFWQDGRWVQASDAVDAVMLHDQAVVGVRPYNPAEPLTKDEVRRSSGVAETLCDVDQLRYFLARHALQAGQPEPLVHRLVEGPGENLERLQTLEHVAGSGIAYRSELGDPIPASPGMLPYLAERSGKHLQFSFSGVTWQPVQDMHQLEAAAASHVLSGQVDAELVDKLTSLRDSGVELGVDGKSVAVALPGEKSAMHVLPSGGKWDANGIVHLAQVKTRAAALLQEGSPLAPGSLEMHQATEISGKWSEDTLSSYLLAISGTPDNATSKAAQQAFGKQVDLLDKRVGELEQQGHKDALTAQQAQTDFLQASLQQSGSPTGGFNVFGSK